jgi:type 1 glutamine amidotransferase
MKRLVRNITFLMLLCSIILNLTGEDRSHPVPKSTKWLTYKGDIGPGKGKHIVLIAAEQEYRSEQSMPMMASILAKHHGFDCTLLFGVNDDGLVDPTMPVYPKKGEEAAFKQHNIPGLEHLESADLVIFLLRLLTLPHEQQQQISRYLDSGKPIIALRTTNHGFRRPLPYKVNDKQVRIGDLLGGTFLGHHGNWHRDSTRGDLVEAMMDHPILKGVSDIWGPSDVYRTYKKGENLPEDCTALVYGQPLIGRKQHGLSNPEKEPLPVVWIKHWTTTGGRSARVFHSTMGSAKDLENPGLRRLLVNATYWGAGLEESIDANSNVSPIGDYVPLASGFNYEKLGIIPQAPSAYRN